MVIPVPEQVRLVRTRTSSAPERLSLLTAGCQLFFQNFLFGLGAYRTPDAMLQAIGAARMLHNTYLEILLTGGLFGGLAIIIYAAVALRALATSRVPGEKKNQGSAVVSLLAVFALAGWFLSLNYSSILWLPLVLVLAHRDNTRE